MLTKDSRMTAWALGIRFCDSGSGLRDYGFWGPGLRVEGLSCCFCASA